MKTHRETPASGIASRAQPLDFEQRKTRGVVMWAAVGAVSLAVIAQGWTRWLFSDDFQRTDPGPDKFGGWREVYLQAAQIIMPLAAIYVIWRFIVVPWRRERILSLDGMIILAFLTAYFYDPLTVNYFNNVFSYNSHFFNMGSWANFTPGWHSPNQELLPEPLLMMSSTWIVWCFGFSLVSCWALRRLRVRYPRMSNVSLFAVIGGLVFVLDLIVEPALFVYTEIWAYPGTIRSLTLWPGSIHQFPIYESLIIVAPTLMWTAVRWFKDDKGRSFVERGVDQLNLPHRGRRAVSFLAVTGFVHLSIMVFSVPYNLVSIKADSYPPAPSYMRNGICGEGTEYACANKYVPMPSKSSLHVGPDDPGLPESVRSQQGIHTR